MRKFKVVGPCRVADTPPGEVVTEETLNKWGALIEPLLGVHLQEVRSGGAKATKEDAK